MPPTCHPCATVPCERTAAPEPRSSRNPSPGGSPAASSPACSMQAVLISSLGAASALVKGEGWAGSQAPGHSCSPGTHPAPGVPRLPHILTSPLGAAPRGCPESLCAVASGSSHGAFKGPWSKAKPSLTCCVPPGLPRELGQAPCALRAAPGDEELLWPSMEWCLLLLK